LTNYREPVVVRLQPTQPPRQPATPTPTPKPSTPTSKPTPAASSPHTPAPQPTRPHQSVSAAIAKGRCTFTITKKNPAPQQWFHCTQCSQSPDDGCWVSCASRCHAGHTLVERDVGPFVCSCGFGNLKSVCMALDSIAHPSAPSN